MFAAAVSGPEDRQPGQRHGMNRQPRQRLLKSLAGFGALTTPQSNGAYGVPGIGATLARVQMTAGLVRQFAVEVFERAGFIAAGVPNQPAQPVERNAAEPCHAARLVGLRRDASR